MTYLDYFEKIEDYLKNRLSDEEKASFEAEMQADPDLAGEVALHRDIMAATREPEVAELRAIMQAILEKDKKTTSQTPRVRSIKPLMWLAAAVVVLLVAISIWQFLPFALEPQPSSPSAEVVPPPAVEPEAPIAQEEESQFQEEPVQQKPKPESVMPQKNEFLALASDLYAQQPYEVVISRGEGATDELSRLEKAELAFAEQDYQEVIRLLETLVEGSKSESLKLRGHANFQLGNYKEAQKDFRELSENRFQRYDAQWYLLLAYLAQLPDSRENFDDLMEDILSNENHPYLEDVRALNGRL